MGDPRSLDEWLTCLESLNPATIVMGLERVREVAGRLALAPPPGAVFTVAGTNGKGSTARLLQALLLGSGARPGLYTSPHLCHYSERIRIGDQEISDEALLAAFAAVEAARGTVPLTYFEFGTLAALQAFSAAGCDAWVLEVGMGGRLDAVNVIDPDYSLITTVDLDHQQWLGDTVEAIAAEKAGILRAAGRGYYGDLPVPGSVRRHADALGLALRCQGVDFGYAPAGSGWSWQGGGRRLDGLPAPAWWSDAQYRNAALALAAWLDYRPGALAEPGAVAAALAARPLPGRCQRLMLEHEWVLDVAHNPQAARTLRAQLQRLPAAADCTLVLGLLGDKEVAGFAAPLAPLARRLILCGLEDPRAGDLAGTRAALERAGIAVDAAVASPAEAFALARGLTTPGGRIIVCGSFRVVGPALQWLELN
jgi:dihydrofolate synthase/folylpolyglutamate synthase